MAASNEPSGRIVTFYSYKGGVGRTMALANIACLLARWGYSVLCVDWDLEAPGLHYYLGTTDRAGITPGLAELVLDKHRRFENSWEQHLTSVSITGAKRKFDLITSGIQNQEYLSRVQEINWPELYREHQMGRYLEQLRDEWKSAYDFVLIDSRTGITDVGGICTLQLPDLLVLLFTANFQGLDGIAKIAKTIAIEHSGLPVDRPQLPMLPVITSFAGRTEVELGRTWLKHCEENLGFIYSKWAHRDALIPDIINCARVPYFAYWSFGESLPVIGENERDPETISYAFATIAAMIAKNLSATDASVRNRDEYVDSAQRHASEDIVVYFAGKDREVVTELKKHISPLLRLGLLHKWIEKELRSKGKNTTTNRSQNAGIALILVSPDLWATDFQNSTELEELLSRRLSGQFAVFPIIVRYADWKDSPLGHLEALPQDGVPIVRFENPDSAYAQIALAIRNVAERITKGGLKETSESSSREKTPKSLFLCYSHNDRLLVEQFEMNLTVLRRRGIIDQWQRRVITQGDDWIGRIDEAVETADIILLFVSADFLNSDYCYDREVKRALERQANREVRVIPVILRPTLWQDSPFGNLQALPRGGRAVTEWPSTDEAIMDIVSGLEDVIRDVGKLRYYL